MFAWLKRRTAPAPPLPSIPAGQRIYAIGDVHGRLDLLTMMLDRIEADAATLPAAETLIILLGDLIDRGPASSEVIELVSQRIEAGWPIRTIMGNHEQVLLAALGGDADELRRLLRMGGVATLESYGITIERLEQEPTDPDGVALLARAIPPHHQLFLGRMEDWITVGDYLFVHAGIRPGVPIEEQVAADLRWIRKPFLGHRDSFGPVVVHGHSIRSRPDLRGNRLGIDTGAYRTGRLTALVLEGSERRVLQVEGARQDATLELAAQAD